MARIYSESNFDCAINIFPLLKIHSTKSTSHILMIQIQLKAERWKNFYDFSRCLTSIRFIGKLNFTQIYGCKMTDKWSKTLIKP